MKVVSLEHVSITSPEDLEEEVVSWYRDCLELQEMEKPEGTRAKGAWFRIGDQQLHVTIDEHNPPKVSHVGLIVDDFGEIVERLRGSGCHIEQAAPTPGRRRFYTRDPAGNRIEIISLDEPVRIVASEQGDTVGVKAEES
ncbi:MAG: VOC family protein [Actinobacteria bacterium]|nr:VOC family protein [Actinomycetota bacterium]